MAVTPGQARVVAPLLALGLGAPAAGLASLVLLADGWSAGAAMAAAFGLAFAMAGAVALVSLWRKRNGLSGDQRVHGERANVALFVIFALLMGLCGAMFTQILTNAQNGPVQRVAGQVEHLHVKQRALKNTVRLKLDGEARTLNWSCRFDCGDYAALLDLRDAPWPKADADRLGSQLVGLRIEGRTYLSPERERARLVRGASIGLGLMVAIGILMTIGALSWLRNRPSAYDGLDTLNAARARHAMRRILPDPPRSRR